MTDVSPIKASELKIVREVVGTGIASLDELLGGGIELGCITEIFGEKDVGKSTLALQIVGAAQKQGLDCLFSDTERRYTNEYASLLGVDVEKLDLTRFRIAEDTFDAIQEWVENHKRAVVVLDSMGGVLPREEAEKTAEGRTIGIQARLMGAFCRKINALLDDNKVALLIVNHQVTNLNTGAIGSSGGSKLEHFKKFSIRLKRAFGKNGSVLSDGTKRTKIIEAQIKKEKGELTAEGRKVELVYEKGRGFVNEPTPAKKGRPAK